MDFPESAPAQTLNVYQVVLELQLNKQTRAPLEAKSTRASKLSAEKLGLFFSELL